MRLKIELDISDIHKLNVHGLHMTPGKTCVSNCLIVIDSVKRHYKKKIYSQYDIQSHTK